MSNTDTIKVFLRVRPSKQASGFFEFDEEHSQVEFNVPVEVANEYINNTKTNHKFRFDGLLGMGIEQDSVFHQVAEEAVESALGGYNATIFAYGQTGSGKTFTMTGGPERYEDRGIIPRALSYIFKACEERKDYQYTVYISYLEIYNESGYDLLDPSHDFQSIHDLPRVTLLEDEDGNVHLRGLSMHLARDEEEALNYLFLGDTNRAICETPMNPVSSRSHCIFTISVESRQEGSAVVRRSKLHLVDLAGSERVHKTHAEGQIFREATHINKSLHFLEMVIVALHERATKKTSRIHVPYRNSMMTSVLRDSLGGNCKTAMVATINPERDQTGESLSTCRFAQRVARIRNDAIVNVETDPHVLVQQLRAQVSALEAEAEFLRGEAGEGEPLSEEDERALRETCRRWVAGEEEGETPPIGDWTTQRLRAAFIALRDIAREGGGGGGRGMNGEVGGGADGGSRGAGAAGGGGHDPATEEETRKLRQQLQQRDSEIAILVNMVKEAKAELKKYGLSGGGEGGGRRGGGEGERATPPAPPPDSGHHTQVTLNGRPVPVEVLSNKDEAFALFRAEYPKLRQLEQYKEDLRAKYGEAKAMGARVNEARSTVTRLKGEMEQLRTRRAVASAVAEETGGGVDGEETEEERRGWDARESALLEEMEESKEEYKSSFQALRDLKGEIEHIQRLLEAGRIRLQADFEGWYSNALLRLKEVPEEDSPMPPPRSEPPAEARRAFHHEERSRAPEGGHPPPRPQDGGAAAGAGGMPYTGQEDVDADIRAFYQAKQQLQARRRRD